MRGIKILLPWDVERYFSHERFSTRETSCLRGNNERQMSVAKVVHGWIDRIDRTRTSSTRRNNRVLLAFELELLGDTFTTYARLWARCSSVCVSIDKTLTQSLSWSRTPAYPCDPSADSEISSRARFHCQEKRWTDKKGDFTGAPVQQAWDQSLLSDTHGKWWMEVFCAQL